MRDLATAIAIVGIAFSVTYCCVTVNRTDKEARADERKHCTDTGGRWSYGWASPWCDYKAVQ